MVSMLLILGLPLCAIVFYLLIKIESRNEKKVKALTCCKDSYCEGDCGGWGA